MVAKINRGASLFGAVMYNQEKVNEGTARIISGNRMMTDITQNPENVMRQTLVSFENYLLANRKTEKPVLHISLNPSPEDNLSEDQFASLAKDYMEKMGYGDQPYIVYIHEDIDRRHIHIVSTCVDENGKKINDSYEHRRSMDACRELETKYSLKPVADIKKEQDAPYLKKVDYLKGDVKRQIANTLKSISDYKFQTFGEYNALLSCFNIEVKTVKGVELSGKEFNGIVYSATDNTGKAVSNPFKSSLFGKSFGHAGLNRRMMRYEREFKEKKFSPNINAIVANAMRTTRNKQEFLKNLSDKGIDAVFRTNEAGRIYGVTFIDHNNKEVYNGSRLGKEFSANVFEHLFNEPEAEPRFPKQDDDGMTVKNSLAGDFSLSSFGLESVIEQAFGLFDFTENYPDSEDEYLAQRRKKKKKKQQRHI
jgi:hypothetical protein